MASSDRQPWHVRVQNLLAHILSAALCCLFAAETLLVAYNYQFYTFNPPSSELLVLAEALKLLIAGGLYLAETKRAAARPSYELLDKCEQQVTEPNAAADSSSNGWRRRAFKQTARAYVVFSVPAVCYFCTNK